VFDASKNTKFDVHCAPCVSVCTPGCTGAVAAGAHVGAAAALPAPTRLTSVAAASVARVLRMDGSSRGSVTAGWNAAWVQNLRQ
jgi:hypothetical protein